jgi:hypothetical protein
MTSEEADALVQKCSIFLGEHFDAVQILASWNEQGLTNMTCHGCGNWYARQGMAKDFINTDQAQEIATQLADKLPKPADDGTEGDEWKTQTPPQS